MRKEGFVARVVAVRLRDAAFTTRIRQRALRSHTQHSDRIFEVARALFREHWHGEALRLVGVRAAALEAQPAGAQTDLFGSGEKHQRLNDALDAVRNKLGEVAVVPAATLRQQRGRSHVPFGAVSQHSGRSQD